MRKILFAAALLFPFPALAQQAQQPDALTLQRTIAVLEQQRNHAMNAAAVAETRALVLADDLAKAQAKIKDLEPKSGGKAP